MRGLMKAAALLSSTLIDAFVVPEPIATQSVGVPVLEYHPSKAFLSFGIGNFQGQNPFGDDKNFTIEINSSKKPCGESNVSLLGHDLTSDWDGSTKASGRLIFPDIDPSILAEWQIHCLFDNAPADGSIAGREDVAQVLSLNIQQFRKDFNVGFTVSYKQTGAPTVLQFSPRFIDWESLVPNLESWQTPSPDLPTRAHNRVVETDDTDEDFVEPSPSGQNIFWECLQKAAQYLKKQASSFRDTAAKVVKTCHTHLKNLGTKVHKAMASLCPEHRHGQEDEDQTTPYISQSSSNTNVPLKASPDRIVEALPPAQTRSLHTAYASPTPSTQPSYSSHSALGSPPTATHFLKLVSIAFLIFSLLTYIIIWIRDPRRRADRAARREECRNKRLYRRAAWSHWWQTRICALRHRRCPRSRGTGTCDTWDEKRVMVMQQEEVLEAVAQHDIRNLRLATRPGRGRNRHVDGMTAAEEGRNDFLYESESDSSDRRRRRRRQSTTTLPGYESEGTLPPGYTTVIEDTPDSSVVSTSPRISRDDFGTLTDSEDGKSIEGFSLGAPRVVRDLGRDF